MADTGWGFGWILAGIGVGVYAGYKLIPWMTRIEETEKLQDLAERVLDLAEEETHKTEALECLRKIEKYRAGLMKENEETSDKEHTTMVSGIRKTLRNVTKKLYPFSINNKEKKQEVESELDAA